MRRIHKNIHKNIYFPGPLLSSGEDPPARLGWIMLKKVTMLLYTCRMLAEYVALAKVLSGLSFILYLYG